jgi:class 3 adenylate cyclase/DNA-binding winged helix-turn-helix (wHTH) protein
MLYVFGDCVFNMRLRSLHRAGVLISLGPKAFSVFAYLLQHRDRVVVKQELNDLLWPGQFVSDAALARCITLLRKAVGDTGKQQEIIKTLYGHGYRFIAGVDERPITPPASAGLTISLPPNSQALDPTVALPGFPLPGQDRPLQSEQSSLPVRNGVPQEVTVLCGTLAHTELLAARLTPEALHRLVCGFFEQAWQAVHRCGGIIQAFLDDGFLALFGVPVPCEDHAWRAVRAAMWLQRSLRTQSAAPDTLGGEPVGVRLGMHTGMVVGQRIGCDQRLTYTALGDTMRVAMRLQHLAEPDTLLLSDATARQVPEAARVEACGPLHVPLGKQRSQQLRPVYRARQP